MSIQTDKHLAAPIALMRGTTVRRRGKRRIVLADDCYQGVAGLAESGRLKGLWSVGRLAVDDTGGWIEAAAVSDLLWLESPSNPLLVAADLRAICSA